VSEHHPEPGDQPDPQPTQQPEATGNPTVDAVLESLAGLEDTPVDEHVAVFETAHDTLRGALANAGNPPTG